MKYKISKTQTQKFKNFFCFFVCVFYFWFFIFGFNSVFALKVGEPLPNFNLPDLEGRTVQLHQSLGEKATILSFFASWSKSCQEEIKFLQQLYKEHPKEELKIVGVSFDSKLEKLDSFIKENEIKFEIVRDKKLSTLDDFQILIIPTLLVANPNGTLKSIYVDFDENVEKALTKEIQQLLEPKSE